MKAAKDSSSELVQPTVVSLAVGNRRLLKLADFLKTVPRARFDFEQWVGWDWQGNPKLSCGTKACALGWATTIPAFRRLGLRLNSLGNVRFPGAGSSLEAAMGLFGIEHHEALQLFVYGEDRLENPTPKQVARHIERFVLRRTG